MKVALFFDGKNFYTALRNYDANLEIELQPAGQLAHRPGFRGQRRIRGGLLLHGLQSARGWLRCLRGPFFKASNFSQVTSSSGNLVSVDGHSVESVDSRTTTGQKSGSILGWSQT